MFNRIRQLPTRYVIGLMAFMSSTFAYILRASLTLNLLAMVIVRDENGTRIEQPDFGPRYDYGAYEQGLLLGAFYYTYPVSTVFSGFLLDRYGIGRQFTIAAFVLAAGVTLLSPWAASATNIAWLFAARLLIGLSQGGVFPNIHRLISKWAPPDEIGMFTVAIMGSNAGTILAWVICGPIIETWGWQWSFYVVGILVAVFVVLWTYNVYDRPALHPRIGQQEREYVETATQQLSEKDEWPPLRRMFASMPFWALLLMQFSSDWGVYFLMTGVPKFLNEVLGFQISSTGLLAALPYVARMLSAVLFGYAGDFVRARQLMSVLAIRRAFCLISHVLPGLLMLAIPFAPVDRPYVCIVLMVLAFGCNGAVTQTALANYHDLAPAAAASTMATANAVAGTSGFISPLVVAFFTSERNTALEWKYVFVTGASVYMVAALVFMVAGSADDQHWNQKRVKSGDQVDHEVPKREEILNKVDEHTVL